MRKKTKREFSENTYINGESKKRIRQRGPKRRGTTTTKDGGDKKEKAEAKASQRPRTKGEGTCQKYKMQQPKGFCLLSAFSLPDPTLRFFLASGVEILQEASASLTPVFLSSDYTDCYFLINFLNQCLHLLILWLKTLQ